MQACNTRLSSSSSSSCMSNTSSDNFKHLIRFKQRHELHSSETLCSSRRPHLGRFLRKKKKVINLYKVQKTYRFRNYRLHCVRLRRLEKKSKSKLNRLRRENSVLSFNFSHSKSHQYNKTASTASSKSSSTSTSTSSGSSSSTENFNLEESSCNSGCMCSSEEFVSVPKRNRLLNKATSASRSTSGTTSSSSNETSSTSASGRSRSSSRGSRLSFSTSKGHCFCLSIKI